MSDTMTSSSSVPVPEARPAGYENTSPGDQAIISAKYDRKQFIAALDAGTLACLPDKKGFADTQAACNVINRTIYQGSGQLLLKDFQKRNGFPTAEFCTIDQIEKASAFAGKRIYIKKESKGITLSFLAEGEQKNVRLFNLAQLHDPELIHSYAEHRAREQEKYGEPSRPPAGAATKQAVSCTSSEPDVYLGQYLAALTEGRPFKVSAGLAEEFKQKAKDFIFERTPEGHINPFNLSRLGGRATGICKEILSGNREAPQEERQRPARKQPAPAMER